MYFDEWSFRIQRFLFPHRKLYSLRGDRFVFEAAPNRFLCGLEFSDFGLRQSAFCVTRVITPSNEPECHGSQLAAQLRDFALKHGDKECLVLYSPSGWPHEAWKLQKDGIIWNR